MLKAVSLHRTCLHSEGTPSQVTSCPSHRFRETRGSRTRQKDASRQKGNCQHGTGDHCNSQLSPLLGWRAQRLLPDLALTPHSHSPSSQVQQTQPLTQSTPSSPLRQGHKHEGTPGAPETPGGLCPPRSPACTAQTGSFLRALRSRHKGKTETNFWRHPQTSPFGTCGPSSQSVLTEATPSARRQAVLPRLEPLCFPTQLPPTSHGAPGAGKRPPSAFLSPESQTLASRGPPRKGRGRGCPPPPARTEPPGLFPANNAGLTQPPESPPRTAARTSPRGSPLGPQVPTESFPRKKAGAEEQGTRRPGRAGAAAGAV